MNQIDGNVYKNFVPMPLDLQGWGGDDPFFETIITKYRPKTIIEIGTWKGQSAITMAQALKKNNLYDSKIYCIDTWLGALEFWTLWPETQERNLLQRHGYPQVYYQFLSNVIHKGLTQYIVPIPNTSQIGLKILKYKNIKPDLIYIDGSHEEDDVYQDLALSYSYLEKGMIFGDDHAWDGVRNAINRFSAQFHVYCKFDGRFWIFEKL